MVCREACRGWPWIAVEIAVGCRGPCHGSRAVVTAMGGHGAPRLAVATRGMPVAARGNPWL